MPEAAEGEFDLRSLNDAELIEQVHDDMYNGLKAEVEEATRIFLERGWAPDKVLNDALVEGMRIVGIDFRDGILFVPEVLLAANAMKGGMAILRPLLGQASEDPEFQEVFARASDVAGDSVRAGEAYAEAAYLNGRAEQALVQLNTLKRRQDLDYYARARIDARIAAITPTTEPSGAAV